MITIAAPGVDAKAIIHDILQEAERKKESGIYQAQGLDETTLRTPLSFGDNASFLAFYMEHLRDNVFVDITDFEITEKRVRFRRLLVQAKKLIWSALRFYTYRLWSQQNQINGLLLAAADGIHEQQVKKDSLLEARIAALEQALLKSPKDDPGDPVPAGTDPTHPPAL